MLTSAYTYTAGTVEKCIDQFLSQNVSMQNSVDKIDNNFKQTLKNVQSIKMCKTDEKILRLPIILFY